MSSNFTIISRLASKMPESVVYLMQFSSTKTWVYDRDLNTNGRKSAGRGGAGRGSYWLI